MSEKTVTAGERCEALVLELAGILQERSTRLSRSQVCEILDGLAYCAAWVIKSKNTRRCMEHIDFFMSAAGRHFNHKDMPVNFGVMLGTVEIQKVGPDLGEAAGRQQAELN